MSNQISSPVVNATGKTKLRESLERAKAKEGPSIGQWLMFPGYTLAKTVAGLGMDVSSFCDISPVLVHPYQLPNRCPGWGAEGRHG